jgi:phosphate starvation-inducible PhoH-like protein
VTQVDLPTGAKSGLRVVRQILGEIDRIKFFDFSDRDVVRHPVVQRIVMAYDRADKEREAAEKQGKA